MYTFITYMCVCVFSSFYGFYVVIDICPYVSDVYIYIYIYTRPCYFPIKQHQKEHPPLKSSTKCMHKLKM